MPATRSASPYVLYVCTPTVAPSASLVGDNFLEEMLRVKADGMASRVVDGQVLVWYSGERMRMQSSQKVQIPWGLIVEMVSCGQLDM